MLEASKDFFVRHRLATCDLLSGTFDLYAMFLMVRKKASYGFLSHIVAGALSDASEFRELGFLIGCELNAHVASVGPRVSCVKTVQHSMMLRARPAREVSL